ncbi:MAG: hypothetical protein QM684_01340 [Rhizobium sp.]
MKSFATAFFVLLFYVTPSWADSISECNPALVIATYSKFDHNIFNYKLSTSVSKDDWSEASKKFGATGMLYGVPIGLNFDSYHRTAQSFASSHNVSLSKEEFASELRHELGSDSVEAYTKCLATVERLRNSSLQIGNVTETDSVQSVEFMWRPIGHDPRQLPLKWTAATDKVYLSNRSERKFANSGTTPYQFRKLDRPVLVTVNADGRALNFIIAAKKKSCEASSSCETVQTAIVCKVDVLKTPISFSESSAARVLCPNRLLPGNYYLSIKAKPDEIPPGVRAHVAVQLEDGPQGKMSIPLVSNPIDVMDPALRQPLHLSSTIEASRQPVTIRDGRVALVFSVPSPLADIVNLQPIPGSLQIGKDVGILVEPTPK